MFNERQLMLRRIDLPTEEGDTSSVGFCRVQELKRIMCCSRRPAEYAHYDRWIIGTDLFHGGRTVVRNLQELWTGYGWNAGEKANDMVIQKRRNSCFLDSVHISGNVWAEDLQKMVEALFFRFLTKGFIDS